MNDYVRALSALKNLLPEEALREFAILEARMIENLQRERLYGGNEVRADRYAIVDALNQLAWQHGTKSFTECYSHPQLLQVSASTVPQANPTKAAQGLKKVVPPRATVQFFTRVLPTAYYHLLSADDFRFFLVSIDNTDPESDDATLLVSAYIEDHSDLAKTTVPVAKGERKDVKLLPVLKHSALTTLAEMRKVTLHISIRQTSPHSTEIDDKTWTVYLLARDRALIAIREKSQPIVDLTKYLVAWVTPNHPDISRVLSAARGYHPQREFRGYQEGETTEETAASVREQARALFFVLKETTGLAYANSTLNWEIQPNWITQIVRLPGECLAHGGIANCLDGAVLFASLLERIGIEPLLVLVPGHAFVGWRIEHDTDEYEFLDTTMIGSGDFDQAQTAAKKLYTQALENGDFGCELFHQPGFARLIDVVRHRRDGIYPLE